MRHYSHTRFNQFETCPRSFKLRYLDRIPEKPSDALIIGRLVHEIIAEYDRALLKSGLQTDITLLPEITQMVFYKKPHHLGSSRFTEIESIIESFANSHIFNPNTTVGIEEKIKLPLSNDILFWAVLDRLEIDDNVATIMDYKTDWAIRSQAETENDFQLHIYAWIVKKEYPQVDTFKARLEFVRHGVVREVDIDPVKVATTEDKIFGLIRQIESEVEFAPRPGEGCSWCSYVDMCPALKNLGGSIIKDEQDALRVAGELVLLEKQVADRKEALKKWCNVNGFVETNGLQWGYYVTESKSISDVKEFTKIMRDLGEDPEKYLSVDERRFTKKLQEKYADALASVLVDKSYTRFDSKKTKNGNGGE